MGVQRRRIDSGSATMSPEEQKMRDSGFWHVDHRIDTMDTVAKCDLHKLHEAVNRVMMDSHESRLFRENPQRYMAARWGEATAKVYFSKHPINEKYIAMQLAPDWEREMAYWTGSGTTSTTSGTYLMYDQYTRTYIADSVKEAARKVAKQDPRIKDAVKFEKKLVRTLPFVHGGDSLLATLQREFDHWAGPALKELTT